MKNTIYYFMPLTEFEFLLFAGVSQIIKKTTNKKTILIHTEHPRIKDKMHEYHCQFDEVIPLPFCDYRLNILAGYKSFFETWKKVSEIPFYSDRVLFNTSSRQLVNMLVLHHFRKKRGASNATFTQILPYPENKVGMATSVQKSLLMNAYSLLLGRTVFYRYERQQPNYYGYIAKPDWDVRIYIEHKGSKYWGKIFQHVPSTLYFIDTNRADISKCNDLVKPGIIVFVDGNVPIAYGLSEKRYWEFIRFLCNHLKNKMNLLVYVKMHPAFSNNLLKEKNIDAIILNKNVVAEEYFIFKKNKILGIFSTASTALLSGAWMGIPAFNFSDIVGYSGKIRKRFIDYLAPCKGIEHLNNIKDLELLNLPAVIKAPKVKMNLSNESKWQKIINEISK